MRSIETILYEFYIRILDTYYVRCSTTYFVVQHNSVQGWKILSYPTISGYNMVVFMLRFEQYLYIQGINQKMKAFFKIWVLC